MHLPGAVDTFEKNKHMALNGGGATPIPQYEVLLTDLKISQKIHFCKKCLLWVFQNENVVTFKIFFKYKKYLNAYGQQMLTSITCFP